MSWDRVRPPQPLADETVHVWRFRLDGVDPGPLRRDLSEPELQRADRYSNQTGRRNYTVARWALRLILGAYLDVPPADVALTPGRHGKAELAPGRWSDRLRFNLSHSADLGLMAVARGIPVGVDVERHDRSRDLDLVAGASFSARELAVWRALPTQLQLQAFFETWVRKEAFVKALGRGVGFGLRRFDVSVGSPARLERVDSDPAAVGRWSLLEIEPGAGYSGALAAEHPAITMQNFDLESGWNR